MGNSNSSNGPRLCSGQMWMRRATGERRLIIAVVTCYPYAGVRMIYMRIVPGNPWREILTTPKEFRHWMDHGGGVKLHEPPPWRVDPSAQLTAEGVTADP